MGLFFPEDPHLDPSARQTGFERYKQLLGVRFWPWWKVNLLTLAGMLPLAAGIFYAVASSSILVLLPCSLVGGMIAGPFLAGLYDAVLRGLRDDPLPWRDAWLRAWRQNWRGSLVPGAVLGLFAGLYTFMAMLFWWASLPPSFMTMLLYLVSMLLILMLFSVYWPQLVLFQQSPGIRLRNCALFCLKYFWRVAGVGLLQLAYLALMVLFAPWTILLLPVTGAWYIAFLAQLLLYKRMDEAFRIEEQYGQN